MSVPCEPCDFSSRGLFDGTFLVQRSPTDCISLTVIYKPQKSSDLSLSTTVTPPKKKNTASPTEVLMGRPIFFGKRL
jgi:hypothetical protein